MICLNLSIGDLTSSTLFHVIDARTTYKMLLGLPWIHGNGIILSSLHQCFKYYKNGVQKVDADLKPFAETESHLADAIFYTDISHVEVNPSNAPSTGGIPKKEEVKDSINLPTQEKNEVKASSPSSNTSSTDNIQVLYYVRKSRRGKG